MCPNTEKDPLPTLEVLRAALASELRRGLIVLLVLARLAREQYGYTLLKELEEAGFPVDQNTLYPLLRRLEAQGLLSSVWKVEEGRPRRYYARTPLGTAVLQSIKPEIESSRNILEEIQHAAP